jgi:uncharacterized membrane protein
MEIMIEILMQFLLPIIIEVGLVKWRWLTVYGAIAAGFLAFVVLFLAQWSIFPLVTFLVFGSLAGKIGANVNEGGDSKQGLARDHWQVLANGGIFMFLAMLAYLSESGWLDSILGIQTEVLRFGETCHFLALISLAVSCADTLSSDFGRVWGGTPRNIITGKRMLKGVSGGVTGAGFVGAFLGAGVIAVFVFWSELSLLGNSASLFWTILVFGMIGSILDSVLGVLFQAKYLDEMGNQVDSSDSGRRLMLAGFRWVTNDVVNALTGMLMLLVAVMYLCW